MTPSDPLSPSQRSLLLYQDHTYSISIPIRTMMVQLELGSNAFSLAACPPGLLHTQNIPLSSLHHVSQLSTVACHHANVYSAYFPRLFLSPDTFPSSCFSTYSSPIR